MHELSVCRGLLDQVSEIARQHGREQVRRIVLRIGPLSGVEPSLLRQAFTIARDNTIAAAAELHIEEAPLTVFCPQCDALLPVHLPSLACPECGSEDTRLRSGDELLLVSVSFPEEPANV